MRSRRPRRFAALVLVQGLLGFSAQSQGAESAATAILPIPQQVETLQGTFQIDSGTVISIPSTPTEQDLFLAQSVAGEFSQRYGVALQTKRTDTLPTGPAIVIGTRQNPLVREAERRFQVSSGGPQPGAEGYVLLIQPNLLVVDGSDEAGAFYGWQSVRQLLAHAQLPLELPAMRIRDWPSKPIRGIKIYLPGRDNIGFYRRFVSDFMALYKFNFLMVEIDGAMRFDRHPEVNAGWVDLYKDLAYTRRLFPKGPQGESVDSPNQDVADGGVLEKREVADLVSWAREQHVQFVPEMPSLTHSYYLLTRHRELSDPMERSWEWPEAYDATNPATHRLYFDLLDEVIEVTKPTLVHIGHDEWQAPLGTAAGTTSEDRRQQYADDVRSIHDHLAAKGIRTSLYGDELIEALRGYGHMPHPATRTSRAYDWPGALPPDMVAAKIPKDILIFNWFFQEGLKGKGEKDEIQLDRWGFQQVFSCNYGPDITDYTRRSARKGILGAVPASWTATNENNFGKDLIVNFLGWGNLAWSSHWPSLSELTDRVEAEMPLVRQRLSGRSLPSEEGERTQPLALPKQPGVLLDKAWGVAPACQGGLMVGVTGKTFAAPVDPEDPMEATEAKGSRAAPVPPAASPPIPVHADVSSLIFLHALALPAANEFAYQSLYSYDDSADLLGCYEVTYEDGLVTTIPIRYGWNILEWSWARHDKPDSFPLPTPVTYAARAVAIDPSHPGYGTFFAMEWPNPRLGRKIKEVRLLGSTGFRTVARNSKGMENNVILLRAVSAVYPRAFPGNVRSQPATESP